MVASTRSNPDPILAALERIEQRLASVERVTTALAPLTDVVTALPGGIAAMTDTVDRLAMRATESGIDLDGRVGAALRAVEVATTPRAVNGLATLIESKLLEPTSLAVVSQLASALAQPGAAPPVGMWGALRALRDDDVQRALGFILAVARAFGKNLAAGDVAACEQRLESHQPLALEAPR